MVHRNNIEAPDPKKQQQRCASSSRVSMIASWLRWKPTSRPETGVDAVNFKSDTLSGPRSRNKWASTAYGGTS